MKEAYIYLADEISLMGKVDQEMRRKENVEWDKLAKIDVKHTSRMREIVAKIGFPSISKIGEKANADAWLLVQHSPDISFMREYLALMESEMEGEYQRMHFAYLKDRILFYEKKPQIYGTQVIRDEKNGRLKLWKVEDERGLDKRRGEVGLGPVKEYLEGFE